MRLISKFAAGIYHFFPKYFSKFSFFFSENNLPRMLGDRDLLNNYKVDGS